MHLVSARNSLEYCASVALPTLTHGTTCCPGCATLPMSNALRCQHIRKAMRGLEMEHAHPTPGAEPMRAGQAPEGSAAKAPHPVLLGVEHTEYPATARTAPRRSPVACRALDLLAHAGRVRQLGAHGLQPRQPIAARLSRRAIYRHGGARHTASVYDVRRLARRAADVTQRMACTATAWQRRVRGVPRRHRASSPRTPPRAPRTRPQPSPRLSNKGGAAPSPGADVAAVSAVPAQMWQR